MKLPDWHASIIQIGVGKGDLKVPYKLYEIMLERKAEKEKSVIDSIENKENEENLKTLEKKLKYNFKNISNLREALQHSSYVNEHPDSKMNDNERLEFLR
jgi:dsRNA-specific ribonuclease